MSPTALPWRHILVSEKTHATVSKQHHSTGGPITAASRQRLWPQRTQVVKPSRAAAFCFCFVSWRTFIESEGIIIHPQQNIFADTIKLFVRLAKHTLTWGCSQCLASSAPVSRRLAQIPTITLSLMCSLLRMQEITPKRCNRGGVSECENEWN